MNEIARRIMELMTGKSVSCKTGWFDLTAAQLPPYSQPAMEKAVARARSPVGAVASGRHGLGMLSIGGISDGALLAHASNWKIYTNRAWQGRKTAGRPMWRIVTFAHVAPNALAGPGRREIRARPLCQVFHRRRHLPDPAARHYRRRRAPCIRHFERLWQGSDGGFGAVLLLANYWATGRPPSAPTI